MVATRSEAAGFQDPGGLDPWEVIAEAAARVGLRGAVTLGYRGAAGYWLHAHQDLGPLCLELAQRLDRSVQWYRAALVRDDGRALLDLSGAMYTPAGQLVPRSAVTDRSRLDEIPSAPEELTDDALMVLLEMHEAVHWEDGWVEERQLG